MSSKSHTTPLLSDEWLQTLISELDNESIIGIILGGSHVRGEATPYSDVDIACFVPDSMMPPRKRFIYRDGHLVSIGAKTVAAVRHNFTRPENAYIVVPAMREIRILLDKDGSIHKMQEEALAFTWEPLQEAANEVASWNMMWQAETVHKMLSILQNYDERAFAYTLSKTLNYLTHTMAVQRGILIKTDNTFYQQVQEAVGLDSAWTHYHRLAAGLDRGSADTPAVKVQGVAWLHLYAEMVRLFRPIFRPAHREVVEETFRIIDRSFLHEEIKVTKEIKNRYHGVALPMSEMSMLQELEGLLQDNGSLNAGESIPVVLKDQIDRNECNIGFCAENNAVVALSVRYCTLTSLPESLGQLTNLQHLDVTGNQLTALPASLGNLLHLKKLYVDDNRLTFLPEALEKLLHLEAIHADENQLAALPESIGQLTNLKTLNAYGNQLVAVPESLSQLTCLKEISLGRNQLIALPESFWQLTNLQLLNLGENHLSFLSESIGNLIHLSTLDIGHNELKALPESLGKLSNLTFFLYISNNHLTSLPKSLENLSNLRYLNLSDNFLTTLPENIGNLTSLKELRVYNNELTTLPESIGKLTNLQELHVRNNRLMSLPASLGNLPCLKELRVSDNRLAALPESLGTLTRLTHLDLRNNRLMALPESLGELTRLMYLDLRGNKLVALPVCIGNLTNLEKLDMRWNKLAALPEWLQRLEQRGCTVLK